MELGDEAVAVAFSMAWALGVVSGLRSSAAPAFNVVVTSHVYDVTPDRLLGPVRSAARVVTWGSIPLGTLAGGFLAAAFGAQPTLRSLTGIMGGIAAAATLARGMRQLAPSSEAGERPGDQLTDSDREACRVTDSNPS